MISKKKIKKLKHLLVKGLYYKLLNTSYIFTYNAWIYCKCDQFQGCRPEDGERSYCFICHVRVSYHSGRIKNLKKVADIINNYVEIKNNIQLCVNLTHYVKTFGFIITKQAGEIVLVNVNGYTLKIILKLLISFIKF